MPKAKKGEVAEKRSRKAKGGDEGETKKRKAKKDPNAPKKPCGAYMFFCKETRESVKEEHPDWGVTQIGKRLGELWKLVDEDDKKKFFDMAEEDKVRYQRDIAKYNASKAGDDEEEDDDDE
jgi:hypothetical protein